MKSHDSVHDGLVDASKNGYHVFYLCLPVIVEMILRFPFAFSDGLTKSTDVLTFNFAC